VTVLAEIEGREVVLEEWKAGSEKALEERGPGAVTHFLPLLLCHVGMAPVVCWVRVLNQC